jgi:hypothetical protein
LHLVGEFFLSKYVSPAAQPEPKETLEIVFSLALSSPQRTLTRFFFFAQLEVSLSKKLLAFTMAPLGYFSAKSWFL